MDTIENSKPEQFSIQDIIALQDDMYKPHWALLALGALLEAADLSQTFGVDWETASEYRAGLNTLIEMSVNKQDILIEELYSKYKQSPEQLIEEASTTCERVRQRGGFRTYEDAFNKIDSTVKQLHGVITTFNGEYPQAEIIKTELMDLKEELTQSAPVQDLQKAG